MWLFSLRNRHFLALDLLIIVVTPVAAVALRDEPSVWGQYFHVLIWYAGLALLVKPIVFYGFGLYNRYWRYASIHELIAIWGGVTLATLLTTAVFVTMWFFNLFELRGFPRSVPLLDGMLTLLLVGASRFSVRVIDHWGNGNLVANRKRALIVGAGNAGALIVRELRAYRRIDLVPVGFVDDDPYKQRMQIHGVPVLGTRLDLPDLIRKHSIQEVIIAMPAASGKVIREIVRVCESANVISRTLPGLSEIIMGEVSVSRLRIVQIDDLLRRESIRTDLNGLLGVITGKRVLVTGAGGSIGSELCRQVLRLSPARIILLGHGENSLFQLSHELARLQAGDPRLKLVDLKIVVADVRDLPRMQKVFEVTRPEIVFHAAAHKHVPLMEDNVEDAVTNNILGTRIVVELAEMYSVQRFVLISSDKAVNPWSIMGATKRVAERIVGEVAQRSTRPYVAVRFGNVLGSRGSVVPLFRDQIAAGGPVTITHPEVRRYFMTIPEAIQLVLQAAILSGQGEVFILDMGEPIKIVDLAHDLIRLSGLQVGRDIDLIFTGLRPGEKLSEESFLQSEDYERTTHAQIFVVRNGYAQVAADLPLPLMEQVDKLVWAAQQGEAQHVRHWLKLIVPEYQLPAGGERSVEPPATSLSVERYPAATIESVRPGQD